MDQNSESHRQRELETSKIETNIHHLPYELLVEIFSQTVQLCAENQSSDVILTSLALVCPMWARIALSTPLLLNNVIWSWPANNLDLHRGPTGLRVRMLATSLERTGSTLLSLTLNIELLKSRAKTRDIWAVVVPHLPRCHSLILTMFHRVLLEDILPIPDPVMNLKHLEVTLHGSGTIRKSLLLNETSSPLQTLVLNNIYLMQLYGRAEWHTKIPVRKLQRLCLAIRAVSMTDTFALFEQCSALTSLTLDSKHQPHQYMALPLPFIASSSSPSLTRHIFASLNTSLLQTCKLSLLMELIGHPQSKTLSL